MTDAYILIATIFLVVVAALVMVDVVSNAAHFIREMFADDSLNDDREEETE